MEPVITTTWMPHEVKHKEERRRSWGAAAPSGPKADVHKFELAKYLEENTFHSTSGLYFSLSSYPKW